MLAPLVDKPAFNEACDANLHELRSERILSLVEDHSFLATLNNDLYRIVRAHQKDIDARVNKGGSEVVLSLGERELAAKVADSLETATNKLCPGVCTMTGNNTIAVLTLRMHLEQPDDGLHAQRRHILECFSEVMPGMFIFVRDETTGEVKSKTVALVPGYIPAKIDPAKVDFDQWGLFTYINAYRLAVDCTVLGIRLARVYQTYLVVKKMQTKSIPSTLSRSYEMFVSVFRPYMDESTKMKLNRHSQILFDQIAHVLKQRANLPTHCVEQNSETLKVIPVDVAVATKLFVEKSCAQLRVSLRQPAAVASPPMETAALPRPEDFAAMPEDDSVKE